MNLNKQLMKKPFVISLIIHGVIIAAVLVWMAGYRNAELVPPSSIEVSLVSANPAPQQKPVTEKVVPKVTEEPALKKAAEEPVPQPQQQAAPAPSEAPVQEATLLKGGYQVIPKYPESLRKRGVEGTVILKAEVLTDGSVGNLWVDKSSGYNAFDESALKAVKQWKFTPAKRMGVPVQDIVRIPVKFTLTEK